MFSILTARAARTRRSRRPTTPWLLPEEEFHRRLARERARADRSSTELSLVVLDGVAATGPMVQAAASLLQERQRLTDDVGWFGAGAIGVLLPETDAAGSQAYLDNLHSRLTRAGCDLPTQVFHYRGDPIGGTRVRDAARDEGPPTVRPESRSTPDAPDLAARPREPLPSGEVPTRPVFRRPRMDVAILLTSVWALISGRGGQ